LKGKAGGEDDKSGGTVPVESKGRRIFGLIFKCGKNGEGGHGLVRSSKGTDPFTRHSRGNSMRGRLVSGTQDVQKTAQKGQRKTQRWEERVRRDLGGKGKKNWQVQT